jgi:AcrR family transcriptional regulator
VPETEYEQQRRARILGVTRELAVDGYEAISMRRIAARAKVSLAAVYEQFGSKDELIASRTPTCWRRFRPG